MSNTDTYQAAARNQNLAADSGPMEKDFENGTNGKTGRDVESGQHSGGARHSQIHRLPPRQAPRPARCAAKDPDDRQPVHLSRALREDLPFAAEQSRWRAPEDFR